MSRASANPSRDVSRKPPSRSSRRAKARAWTRMSSESCVSAQRAKTRRDLLVGSDVARLHEGRADRLGERPHALLDEALDRREADLGAFRMEGLGDPPRDRVVVGDAEDERRLAVEQSHPVLQRVVARQPTIAAMTPDGLRAALQGVRGLVLDADGVIVLQAKPLPGSVEAVRALEARGIPFRVVTNFSQLHRADAGRLVRDRAASGSSPTGSSPRRRRPPPTRRRRTPAGPCSCSPRATLARVRRPGSWSTPTRRMGSRMARWRRSSSATRATTCRTGTWTSRSGSCRAAPSSWPCTATRGG